MIESRDLSEYKSATRRAARIADMSDERVYWLARDIADRKELGLPLSGRERELELLIERMFRVTREILGR